MFRLERNWSQETLCQGICTVSYLSKIEQGKVVPNEALLRDLFAKMEIVWREIPDQETTDLCEALVCSARSGFSSSKYIRHRCRSSSKGRRAVGSFPGSLHKKLSSTS